MRRDDLGFSLLLFLYFGSVAAAAVRIAAALLPGLWAGSPVTLALTIVASAAVGVIVGIAIFAVALVAGGRALQKGSNP